MRRAALALACALLAAPVAAAAAPVLLPSPRTGLSETPPLLARVRLPEQRFPGSISSRQTVSVGVGETGAVRSVRVVQRLELRGLGDYVFAVGAPALEVRPGPGSRSEPGFRRDAIVWQGFSPGRRTLVADAKLRVRAAVTALPLRVTLREGTLTLENATAVRANAFSGEAPARELADALRTLSRAAATGALPADVVVHASRVRPRPLAVDVALRVDGVFGRRRVSAVLGGGRPAQAVFRAEPSARPRLRLTVRLAYVAPERPTLVGAVVASLRLARLRQYQAFLVNPDPLGPVSATYVYRFEAAPAVPPRASSDSGWSAAAIAAAVAAAILGTGGLLALWARS